MKMILIPVVLLFVLAYHVSTLEKRIIVLETAPHAVPKGIEDLKWTKGGAPLLVSGEVIEIVNKNLDEAYRRGLNAAGAR